MIKLLKLILRPAMNEHGFWQAVAAIAAVAGTAYSIYSGERQKQMAKDARSEYRKQQAEAARKLREEEQRLKRIEEEKRDRLRRKGSELPPSILTSYAGIPGMRLGA